MDDLSPLLRSFLFQLPLIAAWLTGWILALIFWGRYPGAALLTFLACSLELLQAIVGTVLLHLMISSRAESHAFDLLGLFRIMIGAASWALVLVAVFCWRKPRPLGYPMPAPPYDLTREPPREFPPPERSKEDFPPHSYR